MDEMKALLRKLAALEESALPPLSQDAVKHLERQLGVRLPAEVVALYRQHGGARRSLLPARLLPPKELVNEQKQLASIEWNERVKGTLLFLWTDDQSNYAALYADGPAKGKVCVIDHGEPSAAPRFGSVVSFYNALLAAHAKDDDLVSLARPARRAGPTMASPRVRRPVKFDPRVTARITRELRSIPWLSRVGEPSGKRDRAWVVVPERRALKIADGRVWEHIKIEAAAIVTVTLSIMNPDAYQHWNRVVAHARTFFDRNVVPALVALDAKLPGWAKARDAIFGSVYAIFAERYYVLAHGLEGGFFTRLRGVFEAGRVPVGFEHPARAGALQDALARGTGKVLVG